MGKLAIGIPWNHQFVPTTFLWESIKLGLKDSENVKIIKADKYMLAASRNYIVKTALEEGCDEILFLDVDQGFPDDLVARLRSHDKDIVSGMVPGRRLPHFFEMYKIGNDGDKLTYFPYPIVSHLQEVDGIGFGSVLVKAKVFETLPHPWFLDLWDEYHIQRTFGNDLYFCKKAQEAGFKVYVDTTCECEHDLSIRLDKEYADKNIKFHMMVEEARKKESKRIVTPSEAAKEKILATA